MSITADLQSQADLSAVRGVTSWSLGGWRKAFLDAFLPVGFPHSVSEDYLAYQFYDSLQAFFSTITALLANRALLEGLGVGDASSSATFALLLTILQDAMSRVATIVFAQRFGLRIEPEAKKYRFLADLFNDTAFFVELFSPRLSPLGKVVALSASQALRALCGVSAGASKAALSVHFAKHDNLAELNAKEASQETAVGLVGLLVGSVVVKYVQSQRSVVLLMSALVLGHLWVNYQAVCSVHMTTLNRQRATILFSKYLETNRVLSPAEVAKRENILRWNTSIPSRDGRRFAQIEFTSSYADATKDLYLPGADSILDGPEQTYFICKGNQRNSVVIKILLHHRAEPQRAIEAWFTVMQAHWDSVLPDSPGHVLKRANDCSLIPWNATSLFNTMESLGWDFSSQAFETGAPVRVRFQKHKPKEA